MEDRTFPGEGVERTGDGGEILDIPPIVAGEAQKRANFCCIPGGSYFSDGLQQRGVGEEAF